MIIKKCDICNHDVRVDKFGSGKCNNCHWWQDSTSKDFPNAINAPNFLSYNEAKSLLAQNKKYVLSFERFSELIDRGYEISFVYNKKRYLVDKHENITLWEINTENYEVFENIREFATKATINGDFLRDNWSKISSIRYES